MKAITYQAKTDTFKLEHLPIPRLKNEYDVVVKVYCVGLNPVDAKVNFWYSDVDGADETFVGGLDVAGEIVELGNKVTGWSVGDKVLYHGNMFRTSGGFAEYAIQDSRTLIHHPKTSSELAASTPCAAWTAYRAVVSKLRIGDRKSIFIAGGSGGVGSFAIQLAKLAGVETIITTCSTKNHEYVKSLGATHVIDYRDTDVLEKVMNITEQLGVEVSVDCVGRENDVLSASVLGYEGQMVELVKTLVPTNYPGAFMKGLSFHQLSLGSGHSYGDYGRETLTDAGSAISNMLEQGELIVPELKVIDFEEIGEALIAMRNERTVGKIVARVAS
ncbi:zinc-binding dehydrogenase [Vibrio hannami]|uniref:zinc-binding dehydrogenase n=1 Tax=Vibrio hannami TaxID=2717094 RepID=UPI0024106011|nr:zinc-binding dehydrogenase [Vibrio hannami]MDG3085351.1 zinc-binding dehydrogenase [Vibrio hannami]